MDTQPSAAEQRRRRLAPIAFGAAGLIGGVIISTTMGANAATTATPAPSVTAGGSAATTAPDSTGTSTAPEATEPKRVGGNETTVTGTKADSVKAAILAKYPGATVNLVESDSNGGYEAEITTAAGASIHVSVSATFVVGAERGGPGGHGGRGPGGHSNTDPAHEAAESPARAAQEQAGDAAAATATPSPAATS